MKNLSPVPRLSLSEAFTILITLVVCLACFTEAEVNSGYRKQEDDKFSSKETSLNKNNQYSQQTSNMRGDELQQTNFANLKHSNSPLEKLIKRHSDYFGESDDSDLEKESDGYGYDDDEYYHVNFKRNEDTTGTSDEKSDKESVGETNQNNMLNNQKSYSNARKDSDKELKTIEMLNFKETHPKIGSEEEQQNNLQNTKQYNNEIARKKQPSSDTMGSLKVIDLKENSAIDETMKERKDEGAGAVIASSPETKMAEGKKAVKGNEEKDPAKLKEAKLGDDSEKKEKEATLKDGKDAVSAKNLKENSKSSEDKEKSVKLSESAKLEENVEKIKSKDSDPAKLFKEDKDISRFNEKVSADLVNPKEISQINNRASFVSNDYKDNLDAAKSMISQGDEKISEEMNEGNKNIGLTDYQEDLGQNQAKEKQFNLRKADRSDNFDFLNEQYNMAKIVQEAEKANPYLRFPTNFEFQSSHPVEYYKKRESWKEQGGKVQQQQQQPQPLAQDPQSHQQQPLTQDQLTHQQQMEMSYESQKNNMCPTNYQNTELENTDYHKNYLKSLRRFKVLSDTKPLNPDSRLGNNGKSSFLASNGKSSFLANNGKSSFRANNGKSSFRGQTENQKKKRSKSKKRRSSMLSSKMSEEKEKTSNEDMDLKLNTCKITDPASSDSQKCMAPPHDSSAKTAKEDTTLSDNKKYENPSDSTRRRRKSQKLEYEIKVINQNQQDSRNAQLSHFNGRLKKEIKTKLTPEDKYLKKYPFSQVSRDDLMKLNEIGGTESEKKFKRKAPIWKRSDEKSAIHIRAAPSGYYSNRVKFGQKSFTRNNEKSESDTTNVEINQPYQSQKPTATFQPVSMDKNNLQRATWEGKQQNLKHDPMKRYDDNSFLNKGNSLLLVKKGERTVKAFEEGSSSKAAEEEMDRDQLAKILSKDNEYVVLKRTEGNKFRKISETPSSLQTDSSATFSNKKSSYEELPQDNLKNNGKQISYKNKGLHVRSSHSDKDDKKYSASLHSSGTKSNFRKTLDKFRDLADFFKDNDQESADNQYPTQEVKEGRDIVFSEDKLPDPIVINADGMGKDSSLKQKPMNSIYSISTNFKNLDNQEKKTDSPTTNESPKNMLTSEAKADNTEFSWEPALKSVFPEAKTINAMNKNGNEIIVLDFNRNQLKTDHALRIPSKMTSNSKQQQQQQQQYMPLGSTSHLPASNPTSKFLNDKKIQLVVNEIPSLLQLTPKVASDKSFQMLNNQNGAFAIVTSEETQPQTSVPLNELADLPSLLKALIEKRPNELNSNTKSITKKSTNEDQLNKLSENYKELIQDLTELSEMSKNKQSKLSEKRDTKEITLPSSSFSELSTYSDANIKQLGNLLQNIMTKDNPLSSEDSVFDTVSTEVSKSTDESQTPDQLYQNTAKYEVDPYLKRQGTWSSDEGNGKSFVRFEEEKPENIPEDVKKEIENLLQSNSESKLIDNELWEEIAAASDKVHRLKREGNSKRKLRKTIEDAMSFKNPSSNSKITEEAKNDGLNKNEETKQNSEGEKSLESEYENHLAELFENLNANKNQKNPNESSWIRKKRTDSHRRKRFSRRDVRDKVSKTEVQNTILKNLPEDNYQSIYSPGIKRRLLSTNIEVEDADGYSEADEHNKNVLDEEPETKCMKNAVNKGIDPMLDELFGTIDAKEEKNRARRSLTTGFHSDFKREIDLDESMPNDFQNFLVTSLGAFGSQTREVMKRDDAFWEGKPNSQDNYNQIVDSSLSEDSALEKREVSSNENRKAQSYKNSGYFGRGGDSNSNLEEVLGPLTRSEKKIRSEDKSLAKSKTSEFTDEKLPTQIRIQITNASSKEKKASKPIMDESESTSTEMENLPKEKEFFDKNKINPLLAASKLQQVPKNKFSYNEYEESEGRDMGTRNKPYSPYRRRKRKKKKYISEDAMKPVKDFIAFDQKAIESLLKKQQHKANANNQNALWSDQTTQKSPVSNHLPQVETVYNPTQGTNKAQLEPNRLSKMNSINNKNALNVKNGLQTNEVSSYNDGGMRSYFKPDKIKSDKGSLKEYEEMDWKPLPGRMKWGPEPARDSQFGLNLPSSKISNIDHTPSLLPNPEGSQYMNPYSQNIYDQKMLQQPLNNYFYHPNQNIMKSHSLYDALKLKQELKSRSGLNKDHLATKPFGKPYYFNDDSLFKPEDKDKTQNAFSTFPSPGDPSWNPLENPLVKKPFPQLYKNKDFYPSALKNQGPLDARLKNALAVAKKYSKTLDDDKPPLDISLPSTPTLPDTTKEADYLENLDDDYLEEDASKDSQSDELLLKDRSKKKMKLHDSAGYGLFNYKNADNEDGMNDDDEEADEDYDETSEEEDLDDYSLLANPKTADPEISRAGHGSSKFQSALHPGDTLSHFNFYYPQIKGNSFMQTKFNSNPDAKFDSGDMKNDVESISGSTSLLKKANENANIFGKNLMKNLNGYGFEDPGNHLDKLQEDKTVEDLPPVYRNKLSKRKLDWQAKLKRSHQYPLIGSRLFYAAKTEVSDAKDLNPPSSAYRLEKSRNSRHANRRLSGGNLLNAEFASPVNDFDNDLEDYGKHMINLGKRTTTQEKEKHVDEEKNTQDDEDIEDVEENLENDGETISDDNVLENVIGKYIMRKKIKSSSDLSEPSQIVGMEKDHKVVKRSTEDEFYSEESPKVLTKRLSSGHLTENNFRKYHKKNLNSKRHINEMDLSFSNSLVRSKKHLRKTRKRESAEQSKRSALDLFKKITNKDRDNKKAENADGRTAGFEPLLSLSDKKYDTAMQDAKEALLLEEKKMPHDASQSETKSPPELKAHYPNEGQQHLKAQLVERKKEKSKESVKEQSAPIAQGPWKVELNEKYNLKEPAEHSDKANRKSFKSLREMETLPFKDSENLKGFLVITRDKNVRAAKRNSLDSLSTSGSFLTEVGSNYRPNTDEGNKQVRKRSLLSTKNEMKSNYEDAALTSSNKPITETRVNNQEKNRALHDTESLSEGEAPDVLQRDSNKNGSFVTTDEQKSENSPFLPIEKLTNEQSVLPPSSDANIIRDSRHINEETSEYLGQQIVGAILSHVSENPKFKELIAPGLSKRTTSSTNSEGNNYRTPLHEMDFSEQLQTFLQKFMLDLEKLAEKQVKKRMCQKIDKQSKQFLQSLLNVPVGNPKNTNTYETLEKMGQSKSGSEDTMEDQKTPSFMDVPETIQTNSKAFKSIDNSFSTLRQKQNLLLKLIDDYQNLSQVQKEAPAVNNLYALQDLDKMNEQSATPAFLVSIIEPCKSKSCQNNTNTNCTANTGPNSNITKDSGYENLSPEKVPDISITPKEETCTEAPICAKSSTENPPTCSPPCPTCTPACTTPSTTPQPLPVLYFNEVENPRTSVEPPSTTPSNFESVHPVNVSDLSTQCQVKCEQLQNATKQKQNPKPCGRQSLEEATQAPESFDLLPSQFTAIPPNQQFEESVRIKQSLPKDYSYGDVIDKKSANFDFEDYLLQPYNKPPELHKLSLGDAAGLQLSLKYRGPWVSNLDVAKTFRSTPTIAEPKADLEENHLLERNIDLAMDVPFVEDFKNPSLMGNYEYFTSGSRHPSRYYYARPIFPYHIDKKFYTPKKRPFGNFDEGERTKNPARCKSINFIRKSPPIKKLGYAGLDAFAKPPIHRKRIRYINSLNNQLGTRKKRVLPHLFRHAKKLKNKPPITNEQTPNKV